MDPASIFILKHRLQAVVFKRNLVDNFSKIFHPAPKVHTASLHANRQDHDIEISRAPGEQLYVEDTVALEQDAVDNTHESTSFEESSNQPDVLQAPDPEDEQACMEDTYIHFESEDSAEDYTTGPSRLIAGFDGVRTCAALLMTHDLSQKIKSLIKRQRYCFERNQQDENLLTKLYSFELDLENEIMSHEDRIEYHVAPKAGSEDEQASEAKQESLRASLEILQQILTDKKRQIEIIKINMECRAKSLIEFQERVNKHLEEAFVHAALLEPPHSQEENTVQDFDLQEEYQKKLQELEREPPECSLYEEEVVSNGNESVHSGGPKEEYVDENGYKFWFTKAPKELDTSRDYLKAKPLTEEQLARTEMVRAIWAAEDRLKDAQRAFDDKDIERERHMQSIYQAAMAYEEVELSPEEFDLYWVKRNQELTRDLIDAEEAFTHAKAVAVKAGVPFQSTDLTSCFGEDFDCPGYPISKEVDVEGAVEYVTPAVEWYLSTMPEEIPPVPENDDERDDGDQPEVDDWDFEELDLSDSLSCVDYGKRRKRIDNWRQDCQEKGAFTIDSQS